MIELVDAVAAYPNGTVALHSVACRVGHTDVCILGANGAGKTSLLRALTGTLPLRSGRYLLDGEPVRNPTPQALLRSGTAHVPQGRSLFSKLSVRDNLRLGAFVHRRNQKATAAALADVLELFPRLAERRDQYAGTLSGGEQQMVAIGRALMSGPSHLIVDELSLGLAPTITAQIYHALIELKTRRSMAITVVEQETSQALKASQYCYVLDGGSIVWEGQSSDLSSSRLADLYLGVQ
jgi:branched-chain amino acid transport system ATP-binding protein